MWFIKLFYQYVCIITILLLLYQNNGVLSLFVNATFTDNAIVLLKYVYILVPNCPDIFFIFWFAGVADRLTLIQVKLSENVCHYFR